MVQEFIRQCLRYDPERGRVQLEDEFQQHTVKEDQYDVID